MHDFEDIYFTVLGEIVPEYEIPWVENAFAEGSCCNQAYARLCEARERLCLRLGADDLDDDLEIMMECMHSIQLDLCARMFDAGIRYVRDRHYLPERQ